MSADNSTSNQLVTQITIENTKDTSGGYFNEMYLTTSLTIHYPSVIVGLMNDLQSSDRGTTLSSIIQDILTQHYAEWTA